MGQILSRGLPLPRGQGMRSIFPGVLPVFITERFPPVLRLFIRGIQGLETEGESKVKTRSEMGYFWTTPTQGGEQWTPQAHVPLPYSDRPMRGNLVGF